ncbi:MAG: DUF2231 domain-containing protein [Gammaproteobacteria bacterium]|nr:MAG: DUF2231 domain-containing protein [Gammaproteobacteria bacterium]
MKLFGHPVHPLLIHFPTALLPMDLGLSVLYYTTDNASFYQAGAYCLWAGAALGLVAAVTGLIDFIAIPRTDKTAVALALYHGFLNGSLILIFAVIAYKSWQSFPLPFLPGIKGLVIKSVLVVALFVGNYLGGRLIYTHHIGIDFKTKTNGSPSA